MTPDQEKRVLLNLIDLCKEQANGNYKPEEFAHLVQGSLLGGTGENITNIQWNRLVLTLQKLSNIQDLEHKQSQASILKKVLYQQILPDIHIAAKELNCFEETDKEVKALFDNFGIKEDVKPPLRIEETVEAVKKESLKKKVIKKISRLTIQLAKSTLPSTDTLETARQAMTEKLVEELKSQLLNIDDMTGPPYEILDSDSVNVEGYKELLNTIYHLQQAQDTLKDIDVNSSLSEYHAAFWQVKEAYDSFSNLSSNAQDIVEEFPDYFKEIKKGADFINKHFSLEMPSFEVNNVIEAVVANLSEPVAKELKGQKPPLTTSEEDPPQIAAIKDLMNATYQIRDAANLWNKGGLQNKTYAAWKAYQAYSSLSAATPEMKAIINDNSGLFEPMFSQAKEMFSGYDVSQLTDVSYLETVLGQNAGRMINYMGAENQKPSSAAGLAVEIVNQLPNIIQSISQRVSGEETIYDDLSLLSDNQVKNFGQKIDALIKLTRSEKSSFSIDAKMPIEDVGSLIKLQKIMAGLVLDGNNISRESLNSLADWSENDLPEVLIWLDSLETDLYLKQGSLTSAVQAPLTTLESLINTQRFDKAVSKVERVVNSGLIKREQTLLKRVEASDKLQHQLKDDLLQIRAEKDMIQRVFDRIGDARYVHDLDEEVINDLRDIFPLIQPYLAEMDDIDYNEELVIQQLNNPKPGWFDFGNYNWRKLLENPSDSADVLGPLGMVALCIQQNVLPDYDNQEKRLDLKVKVVNKSREDLAAKSGQPMPPYTYQSGRAPDKPAVAKVKMGEIKPWAKPVEEMVESKGIIQSIQDLQLSTPLGQLKTSLQDYKKGYLNAHVQQYFEASYNEETGLYQTNENDPQIVTSIKHLENALTNLQTLFSKIEAMDLQGDSLYKNLQDVYGLTTLSMEMLSQLVTLRHAVDELSPEIREQLQPLIAQVESFVENDQNVLNYRKAKMGVVSQLGNVLVDGLSLTAVATDSVDNQLKAQYDLRPSEMPKRSTKATETRYLDLKAKLTGRNKKRISGLRDLYVAVDDIYQGLIGLGEDVNEAFTEHLVEVQHDIFTEFLIPLSRYEDKMFLESGVLLEPALEHLNQVFEKLTVELDVPFEDKTKIFDQKQFFDTLIQDAKEQKILLYDELNKATTEPQKQEVKVKIAIADSKIDYLQEQRQKRLSYLEKLAEKQKMSEDRIQEKEKQIQFKRAMLAERKHDAELHPAESQEHKASRQKEMDQLAQKITEHEEEIDHHQLDIENVQKEADKSKESYNQGLDVPKKVHDRCMLELDIEKAARQSSENKGKFKTIADKGNKFSTSAIKEVYRDALEKELKDKILDKYDAIDNNQDLDEFKKNVDMLAVSIVESFEQENLEKYRYVDVGYKLINELQRDVDNQEHNQYLDKQKEYLKSENNTLDQKCNLFVRLPKESQFQEIISHHKQDFNILSKFISLAKKISGIVKVSVKERNITSIAQQIAKSDGKPSKRSSQTCKAILKHMKEASSDTQEQDSELSSPDQSTPG